MRFFLISLLSLFFLSGCGEKDPAQEFIGEWKKMGRPTSGLVINSDKTGFFYAEGDSYSFTWDYEEDALHKIAIKATLVREGYTRKLSLSGGRITEHSIIPRQPNEIASAKLRTRTRIYERAE